MTDQSPDATDGRLAAELERRLWALFDAAKVICECETPAAWATLYRAVADVPEGQRP